MTRAPRYPLFSKRRLQGAIRLPLAPWKDARGLRTSPQFRPSHSEIFHEHVGNSPRPELCTEKPHCDDSNRLRPVSETRGIPRRRSAEPRLRALRKTTRPVAVGTSADPSGIPCTGGRQPLSAVRRELAPHVSRSARTHSTQSRPSESWRQSRRLRASITAAAKHLDAAVQALSL
jgi:hypothetical protein